VTWSVPESPIECRAEPRAKSNSSKRTARTYLGLRYMENGVIVRPEIDVP
jgi:hypothetical protein